MRFPLIATVACLALVACKTEAPVSTDPLTLMEGEGLWYVAQIGGAPVPEGVEVTMGMMKEGLIGGSAGCNRYNGRIAITDGVLHMGELAGTRMMCPPAQMQVEENFHAAMAEAREMARDGADLVLRNATGKELLRAHK